MPTRSTYTSPEASFSVEYRHGSETSSIHCDYLACGFNLIPNNELPQLLNCEVDDGGFVRVNDILRTSVPGVYGIGEVNGIGGADKAILEGRLAAYDILGDQAAIASLRGRRASAIRFANRLKETFALRPELLTLARPKTIICRCEDVPLTAVQCATNGRDAKLQSRCGMGVCQGRVCGPAMQRMFGHEPPLIRPPVMVSKIGSLAAGTAVGERNA